jgi:hypothetical protein
LRFRILVAEVTRSDSFFTGDAASAVPASASAAMLPSAAARAMRRDGPWASATHHRAGPYLFSGAT